MLAHIGTETHPTLMASQGSGDLVTLTRACAWTSTQISLKDSSLFGGRPYRKRSANLVRTGW